MAIQGYTDYQRREYCKGIKCPIQLELEKYKDGSADYERIRGICKDNCIHTTHEFHHWLIGKGYEIVRKSH